MVFKKQGWFFPHLSLFPQKGCGKLLEKCLSDLRERGYAGVHLITASAGDTGGGLLEFYKKHGFSEEDRVTLMGLEL